MSDIDLELHHSTPGRVLHPSPMSGVRFTRDDERVLYHSRLEIYAHGSAGVQIPFNGGAGRGNGYSSIHRSLPAGS